MDMTIETQKQTATSNREEMFDIKHSINAIREKALVGMRKHKQSCMDCSTNVSFSHRK